LIELQEDEYLQCPHCKEFIAEDNIKIVKAYKCEECKKIFKSKYSAERCCAEDDDDEDADEIKGDDF
jgi:DNA-directed RNA polymerase subunit RPC12/RpoP